MIFNKFFYGISDDGYSNYTPPSFGYLKHVNVHNNIDTCECEFELETDPVAGLQATEAGYLASDKSGNILLFSRQSNRIYKRGSGTYTIFLEQPNDKKFVGAFFYNGIFTFITEDGKVGWMRGLDKSTIVWDYGDIGNIRVNHVPIYAWYTKLYIGGSDNVWVIDQDVVNSQITPGPLTKTSLNLPRTWAVTDLRDLGVNLIWGAYAENNGAIGHYRRFANSFEEVDRTDGPIDTFFGSSNSNLMFALIGSNGDIIHYTGAQAVLRQRIPDVSNVLPNPYNDAILDGRGLVAIHGKVFSYHQRKNGHPFALVHAYTCSGGEDAEIISIQEQTNILDKDQLFVSWQKGDKSGLDSINYNKRAVGLIVTPITKWSQESSFDERSAKIFVEPKEGYSVNYHYLPEGTSIGIQTLVNSQIQERKPGKNMAILDKSRMRVSTKLSDTVLNGQMTRLTQSYITLNPNGADTPIINAIELM